MSRLYLICWRWYLHKHVDTFQWSKRLFSVQICQFVGKVGPLLLHLNESVVRGQLFFLQVVIHPRENTEACKKPFPLSAGQIGFLFLDSQTLRQKIVKWTRKEPLRGQRREDESLFHEERKTKACVTFNTPTLTHVCVQTVWNKESQRNNGDINIIIASHFHFRFKLWKYDE